jgi:hypothetical protein
MVAFDFALSSTAARVAAAVAAAHGITDLESFDCVLLYLVCLLVPLHTRAVTGVFCACSLMHFADDVGVGGSLALHAAMLGTGALFGRQRAMELVVCYMLLVHLPSHYRRCFFRGRRRALALAAVATAVAAVAAARSQRRDVRLADAAQRVAVAHILYESYLSLAGV